MSLEFSKDKELGGASTRTKRYDQRFARQTSTVNDQDPTVRN